MPLPSCLVLEDVRIPEFDLGRPESRNLSLDQRQQLLAARIISELEQERTVFFQLAKLPPDAEFLKHHAVSWAKTPAITPSQQRSHGR
jgi:hypothetical protein